MAVSKRLRYEVLRRDNHTCRYCGAAAPDVKITVDHVVPETLGGGDEASNLVAACQDCNAGKSSSTADAALVEDVDQDAMRWRQAMARAGEIASEQVDEEADYVNTVLNAWNRYAPVGLDETIARFYKKGLPQHVAVAMAEIACNARWVNDRHSYFAKCCWNKLDDMESIATNIVQSGEVPW